MRSGGGISSDSGLNFGGVRAVNVALIFTPLGNESTANGYTFSWLGTPRKNNGPSPEFETNKQCPTSTYTHGRKMMTL